MDKRTPAPHRRIEAEIHIGADNWDDLQESLTAISKEVSTVAPADENLHWVSTGENSGMDVCVKVDHAMTREQYQNDMRQWQVGLKGGLPT